MKRTHQVLEAGRELIWKDLPSLNQEQEAVVQRVLNATRGQSFFITGEAGAGKSVVVKAIINALADRIDTRLHVTASTGVAAIEIGGMTLASFLGVGIHGNSTDAQWLKDLVQDLLPSNPYRTPYQKKVYNRLVYCTHLIVDEVSMLDAQSWSNMDYIMRVVKDSALPYGGVHVIAVGDFCQLPPVPPGERAVDSEKKFKPRDPKEDVARFAFQSPVWQKSMTACWLAEVHRQGQDPAFVQLLKQVRCGQVDDAADAILKNRRQELVIKDGELVTHLYPHNAEVDAINHEKLVQLPGPAMIYHAQDSQPTTQPPSKSNNDNSNNGGTPARDVFKHFRALPRLELRVGAQVMLLRNLRRVDVENLGCLLPEDYPAKADTLVLVNGSIGKVVGFESAPDLLIGQPASDATSSTKSCEWPVVHFPAYRERPALDVCIKRQLWEQRQGPRGPLIASRKQVPLLLAYAVSIHKSQGQTITCNVVADLGNVFEYGQAYVALSRVCVLEQLFLKSYDRSRIWAHPAVIHFYEELLNTPQRVLDVVEER